MPLFRFVRRSVCLFRLAADRVFAIWSALQEPRHYHLISACQVSQPILSGEAALQDSLACIAHKSSEICERCRLWQQNPPATPDNAAAFFEEEFKNSLFRFIYFKSALKQTRKRLFKSFLARNKRVGSPSG